MNIIETVYRAVTGRSPAWEGDYSVAWVQRLQRGAGSTAELARYLGVSRTTVQGWLGTRGGGKRSTPSLGMQELMRSVLRRAELPPGRERRLRLSSEFTMEVHQDGRDRTIHLGQYLAAGTLDRVVTAYLAGASPYEMARVLHAGISVTRAKFYAALFNPGPALKSTPAPRSSGRVADPGEPPGGGGGGGGGGGPAPYPEDEDDEYGDFYDADAWYDGEVIEVDDDYAASVGGVRT